MHLDESAVVDSVRRRCEHAMLRINRGIAYGLTDLAVAFPEDVNGYRYTIERAGDRQPAGCLEGDRGQGNDPVHEYCLVELSNGTRLEFARWRASPEATAILRDDREFGTCVCTDRRESRLFVYEGCWELWAGGTPFGRIRRGTVVTRDNLFIQRPGGGRLPLILARKDRLSDFLTALWRLVSLSFLYSPPPPNRNLIIPHGQASGLSEDELLYYFAISLYLRASVFQLEYAGCGGE